MQGMAKRRALGRGLGALIPSTHETEERADSTSVALATIHPNPMQPRQAFPDDGIAGLRSR